MIATIAAQQVLAFRRQRIFLALLGTVLAMTALAGVIGWSSHNTIVRVYNEAGRLMAAEGKSAPPNPFVLKPTLSLLSNMSIYIALIGALLALVVGHVSVADDASNGIGRLLFSRQLSKTNYALGKMAAAGAVLAVVLAASLVVSVLSLLFANRAMPNAGDLGRLVLFYALSWLYLLLFVLVGMVTMLASRRRSLALLAAMGIWLVLTFAVPQFTSGLNPVASLNPVNNPVSTTESLFKATAKARPFSVSEQYKYAGAHILAIAPHESASSTERRVLPIAFAVAALGLLATYLVRRHDYAKSASDE